MNVAEFDNTNRCFTYGQFVVVAPVSAREKTFIFIHPIKKKNKYYFLHKSKLQSIATLID